MINILPTLGKVFKPANIMSSLDNPSSLLLVGAKDSISVAGRTAMAYKEGSKHSKDSGSHESRERFIEEVGTSLVWLGGIPFCRWAFDKAASVIPRIKNINPNISLDKITSEGIQGFSHGMDSEKISNALKLAKEGASQSKILEALGNQAKKVIALGNTLLLKSGAEEKDFIKAGLNVLDKTKYKQYHIAKLIATTLVPFVVLAYALPKFNQGLTKKLIEGKKEKEPTTNLASVSMLGETSPQKHTTAFSSFVEKHTQKPVSFGGLGSILSKAAAAAQINPVDNMLVVDFGISGSRVINGRNKEEKAEVAIREGGIIFFFFFASKLIQNGLNGLAEKVFKKPIELDFKLLGDNSIVSQIQKAVTDKNILGSFTKDHSEKGVISFINTQLKENKGKLSDLTLKAAEKLGLIDIVKINGKKMLNPTKFVETNKIVELTKALEKFTKSATNTAKNEKAFNSFITKTKALKGTMTIMNILLCSLSLGYILPKLQYLFREHMTGTTEAPGLKTYINEAKDKKDTKKLQAFS